MAESKRVGDFVRENYRQVREQRGLSWEQLAEAFRKDGHGDLEAWAREEGRASDKSARANRGDKPERAVRNPAPKA